MNVKGMRDVATAQTLINRSIPASRAQIVAQLARMEHEQARLERELNTWAGKQQQTQWRLQKLREHTALLQHALDTSPERRQRPSPERSGKPDNTQPAAPWREFPVEH